MYWLARSDYLNLSEIKKTFHPLYFSICFLLTAGALILISERFRQLLKTQHLHLSFYQAWKLFLIGHFFNFVLPGGVGGDLVKAYYLKKEKSADAKTSPFTVIFDRFLGLYTMTLMALTVILLNLEKVHSNSKLLIVSLSVGAVFFSLNVFALAAFTRPLRKFIEPLMPKKWPRIHSVFINFMAGFEFYSHAPLRVLYCFVLTIAAQTIMVLTLYIAGVAAGSAHLPLSSYFFVAPIGMAVTGIPISPPGGIGVGQAAFTVLFNIYLGTKSTIGATVITIFQFVSLCISLGGLYFYITHKKAT